MNRIGLLLAVVVAWAGLATASPTHAQAAYEGTPTDFMQISQLFARYDFAIDNGDGEGWASVFTPDGVFRDPSWCAIGRDELIKVVGRDKRVGKDQEDFHMPSLGPIIYLDRDHATVHSTVVLVRETGFGKQGGGIWITGTYDDRLMRVNGRWLFAYRLVHRPSDKPSVACARDY